MYSHIIDLTIDIYIYFTKINIKYFAVFFFFTMILFVLFLFMMRVVSLYEFRRTHILVIISIIPIHHHCQFTFIPLDNSILSRNPNDKILFCYAILL